MKQMIEPKDFLDLPKESLDKLKEWYKKKGFKVGDVIFYFKDDKPHVSLVIDSQFDAKNAIPCLNIGQMIELLEDKIGYFSITNMFAKTNKEGFCYEIYKPNTFDIRADGLCNALWQAVKSVLADKKE